VVPPERIVREEKSAREQRPITVVVNVTAADAGSFRASQGQIAADMARAIDRASRNRWPMFSRSAFRGMSYGAPWLIRDLGSRALPQDRGRTEQPGMKQDKQDVRDPADDQGPKGYHVAPSVPLGEGPEAGGSLGLGPTCGIDLSVTAIGEPLSHEAKHHQTAKQDHPRGFAVDKQVSNPQQTDPPRASGGGRPA
jgi:hypothetical protein